MNRSQRTAAALLPLLVAAFHSGCATTEAPSPEVAEVQVGEEAAEESALSAEPPFATPNASPPPDGRYLEPHQIASYNPASGEFDQYADVQDCLSLQVDEMGTLRFSTLLIFANGHMCTLAGTAEEFEPGRFVHEHEISETDRCQLTIAVEEDLIVFFDPERSCNLYCGARGSFDGARFARTRHEADHSSCIEEP